tara:strand:- start:4 stop:591 length:588 start_codon:yes stop_codon:yes gene_type:complete
VITLSWFLVLKNQDLVNTTLGATMDWENEVVPEEKKDCKKKLLGLAKYLSNFEIPFGNAKPESKEYTTGTFVFRNRGSQKERGEGHIMVELDIDDIGIFDEEMVCLFNEKIIEVIQAFIAKSSLRNTIDLGENILRNHHMRNAEFDYQRCRVVLANKVKPVEDLLVFRLRYIPDTTQENKDKLTRMLTRIVEILN